MFSTPPHIIQYFEIFIPPICNWGVGSNYVNGWGLYTLKAKNSLKLTKIPVEGLA